MPFAPEAHLSGIEKIRKRKRDIIMRSDSVKTGTAQAPQNKKKRTGDIMSEDCTRVGCTEMGDLLAERI